MPVYLLDANVLIALGWPTHKHHVSAHRWFSSIATEGWATCPFTQCAFVRISTNPKAVGAALTPAQVVAAVARMTTHPRHVFWADDLPFASTYFPAARLQGHQQITDAYLLALCASRGGRLATFDTTRKTQHDPHHIWHLRTRCRTPDGDAADWAARRSTHRRSRVHRDGTWLFGSVFARPIASLSTAIGWGDTGIIIVGVLFQLIVLALIFVLLILLYGNNHSTAETKLLNVAVAASAGQRDRRPPQFLVRGVDRANGKAVEFESRATSPETARKSAEAIGLDLATLTVIPIPSEVPPARSE